jgi:glucose-like phosphotransferase system IIB component
MAGLICMVNTILSIYTPYGGHFVGTCFLDVMTLGIIQDVTGGGINIWMVCIIGLVFSPIYFFFFKWAIKRFDLHTPGRGGNQLFSKKDYLAKKDNKNLKGNERIIGIIEAYGGKDNITVVEACFTRLRVQVKNGSLVNDDKLKSLGAVGVVRVSPTSVQSIFGTEADVLKTKVKEQLEME